MKLKPDALLFDLDGVLVDSLDAWWLALNDSFKKYSYNPVSREYFIDRFWGHDLFDNIKNNDIPLEVGLYCNKAYKNHTSRVRIYDETIPVLEKLQSYKKCIITNTPRDSTEDILNIFNLSKFFNYTFTSDDVKMGKPDPEIILKSCSKLNVKPKDVVIIGDTESDVKAGHAAGCKVIGINVKANITIKNLSETLEHITI